MRVPPASMTFTLLLSFLVALPSFGIDMNLLALTAKGAALHVTPAQGGLMMSLFMLGFAVAPLFYGPASDRYGRKPRRGVRLHALYHRRDRLRICSVAADASDMARRPGCWRWREHDDCLGHYLFEGQAARTRLSYVAIATMVVPMIAPSAGVALLALGGWRTIHAVLAAVGLLLLLAMLIGFAESARLDPASRLLPSIIASSLLGVYPCQCCR